MRKNTDPYASKRILAKELRHMRENSPYYTFLKRLFLTSGSSHSDYDRVARQAALDVQPLWRELSLIQTGWSGALTDSTLAHTLVTYWEENATDEVKTEHAIDLLTERCMKYDGLQADYASVTNTAEARPTRTQTTQELYATIRRVFNHWCETIHDDNPQAKRFRNKAINNTATTCGVSKATVGRALSAGQKQQGAA